jgi:hypothetical protein
MRKNRLPPEVVVRRITENVFAQVALEVLLLKLPLKSSHHQPLNQRDHQMRNEQHTFLIRCFGKDNFPLEIALSFKIIITFPPIGCNKAAWIDIVTNERNQLTR